MAGNRQLPISRLASIPAATDSRILQDRTTSNAPSFYNLQRHDVKGNVQFYAVDAKGAQVSEHSFVISICHACTAFIFCEQPCLEPIVRRDQKSTHSAWDYCAARATRSDWGLLAHQRRRCPCSITSPPLASNGLVSCIQGKHYPADQLTQ